MLLPPIVMFRLQDGKCIYNWIGLEDKNEKWIYTKEQYSCLI